MGEPVGKQIARVRERAAGTANCFTLTGLSGLDCGSCHMVFSIHET